jgi:hypothetical protein
MNGADIEFEISMLQDDWGSANLRIRGKHSRRFLWRLWRRESGFSEVERFVNKSDTIRVDIALRANFTDDADVGLAIGFERTEDQFLLGDEFVTRQDAGAVEPDDDGFGLLGEHPAFTIATDQEDGNCNGNASAATDLVVRHLGNLGKGPRVYPQTMLAKKRTRAREM